jgi:Na+/H+ antiporter NhaC
MEIVPSFILLLPSLIAICLALVTRQVFISLFMGVWVGAWLVDGASFGDLFTSILTAVDVYMLQAIVPADGNSDHAAIMMFSLLTGAMVGIMSRNGGMAGIAIALKRVAHTRRRGQAATSLMGGLIFFDDYCSCLTVGNTMRPLTDALHISRQKLAFLVDSTAAPISCIAVVTTWIGLQATLLEESMDGLALDVSGFELVLSSLTYSFYPLLLLWFIAVMIATGKDFGPMLKAERAALTKKQDNEAIMSLMTFSPATHTDLFKPQVKPYVPNALVPLCCYVGGTLWGIFQTGQGIDIHAVISSSNPFKAVLWGSVFGVIAAMFMSYVSKRQTVTETMESFEAGLQPMLFAAMILTFSWAIAKVNMDLNTADYMIGLLDDRLPIALLPAGVFMVAAATSFATGSSWSTMGILMPLVTPLSASLLGGEGISDVAVHPIFLCTIASVLTGAVWGDHCSPISDTTILSSIASSCPHMEHVKTQMPYAVAVALVALGCGLFPIGVGVPWWGGLLAGMAIIVAIFVFFGKTPSTPKKMRKT